MAFNPQGTVWLCSVPFDITYQHQYQFMNTVNRDRYFLGEGVLKDTLTEYVTIREPLRGGGERSKIRAGRNIEAIRAKNINYMVYCNEHHGTRKFFAFITDLIYVNENMTEIVFETDVYQTWFYDCTVMPSFVLREHSETDQIGDNIVPEKFNFTDFEYELCAGQTFDEQWGYLIGVNTLPKEITDSSTGYKRGRLHSGIYQGMFFYYLESPNEINELLDALEEEKEDCVEFITAIPRFCVSNALIADGTGTWGSKIKGYIQSTTSPNEYNKNAALLDDNLMFDGYKPSNNKMFTHPFFCLYATNHSGQNVEYKIEHFKNSKAIKFKYYGDCSPSPSVTYIPLDYAGAEEEPDFAISLTSFPQCAFNSDSYKLWLAKNAPNNALNLATGAASLIAGITMIGASGGMALPAVLAGGGAAAATGAAGVYSIAEGASGIARTINSMHSASYMPNKMNAGNQKNNLLTAMEQNRVTFYWQKITRHMAETIDSYFTMYGYQTNMLKIPNFNARLSFNYIQTQGINLYGGIPNDDMAKLKSIFDKGITLWRSDLTIGDYSVDNPCIKEL